MYDTTSLRTLTETLRVPARLAFASWLHMREPTVGHGGIGIALGVSRQAPRERFTEKTRA